MGERNDIRIGMTVEDDGMQKALERAQKNTAKLEQELHKARRATEDLGTGTEQAGGKFAAMESIATKAGAAILGALSISHLTDYLRRLQEIQETLASAARLESETITAGLIGTGDAANPQAVTRIRTGLEDIGRRSRRLDETGAGNLFLAARAESLPEAQAMALTEAAAMGPVQDMDQASMQQVVRNAAARMRITGRSANEELARALAAFSEAGKGGMDIGGAARELAQIAELPAGQRGPAIDLFTAMTAAGAQGGVESRQMKSLMDAIARRDETRMVNGMAVPLAPGLAGTDFLTALRRVAGGGVPQAELEALGMNNPGRIMANLRQFLPGQMALQRGIGQDAGAAYMQQVGAGVEAALGSATLTQQEAARRIKVVEENAEAATQAISAERAMMRARVQESFGFGYTGQGVAAVVSGMATFDRATRPTDDINQTTSLERGMASLMDANRAISRRVEETGNPFRQDAGTSGTMTIRVETDRGARVQESFEGVN
jgi:hypothetical protein